jgi:ubiquinone/menaquinone biosynthesis C-methylase UbiE
VAQVAQTSQDLFESWKGRAAGFAPLFLEPVMAPALEHLEAGLRPGSLVLDVGSGGGQVADALRAHGARTICLDVDPGVVAAGRAKYAGGGHVAADASKLPLADASVDAIFCFSVLQYTDRDAAVGEMKRVLRPGGRLVLVENLEGNPLALLYRLWRGIARIQYPSRLTPRRHLAWSERSRLQHVFPGARFDAFYIFATLLLLVPRVYSATDRESPRSLVRRSLGACRRWDAALVRAVPLTRNLAWILLMRA